MRYSFLTDGDAPPISIESEQQRPKILSLWRNQKVYRSAKGSPFGRAGEEQKRRD